MSAQHTPGRMTWKRRTDGSLFYVIGDHTTGPHAQGDIYIDEADLRHLADCWNACHGLPDEFLNSNPIKQLVQSLSERNSELEGQRDELLAALEMFVAWTEAENNHEGTTFWQRVEMLRELDAAAAAAIAKVKGGAA